LCHENKVCWGTQNEIRAVLSAADKQTSLTLNGISRHINQYQDDANGFNLFVWDMKQRLVAIVTGKEGLAQEK
jgi:hypothetical protein